jgi:hypothetical protein
MVRLKNPELLAANDPNFFLPLPPKTIDDNAELGGFTMGDLAQYWRAMMHWSAHCLGIFIHLAMSGKDQEICLPTQVIPRGQFLAALETLSAVPAAKVNLITERLTFDYRNKAPCIFQQPLLVAGGHIAWSPNLIIRSRFDRNMLRLMARTPQLKDLADNLIGGRERPMLNSFGHLLQRSG